MTGERKRSRQLFENGEPLQHGVGHERATPASERKRVHEHGADLLVQLLAHEPPRAMQPRLDRIRLKTEEVRGVRGRQGLTLASPIILHGHRRLSCAGILTLPSRGYWGPTGFINSTKPLTFVPSEKNPTISLLSLTPLMMVPAVPNAGVWLDPGASN
jgi:hypothetical protein